MADKDDDRQTQTDQLPGNEPAAESDNEPEYQDADDITLAEAIAAAEAEEAAAAGETDPDQVTDPQDPDGKQPQTGGEGASPVPDPDGGKGEGQPEGKASPMIPKPRFDEINAENARLREQLAYEKGVREALQGQAARPDGQQQPAEAPKSPEERLTEVRQQKRDLATKYDEGEMSYAELTAEMDKLADQEDAIRAERSQPQGQNAPANTGTDLYLEERTAQLEQQHPYAQEIKSKADWDFITRKAVEELQGEGVALTDDARGDLILRERMAQLTDRYGPMLTGKELSKTTGQQPTNPNGGLSAQAEARKQKLGLADKQPPNLTNSGNPGTPTEYTEEKLGNMSLEDIAELPQSTRDRLAGR